MKNMKVYKALCNPMVEESSYDTLSIHKSREGANKVVDDHKAEAFVRWKKHQEWLKNDMGDDYIHCRDEFGRWEDWEVDEVELLD